MRELKQNDIVRFTVRKQIRYGAVITAGKKNARIWDITLEEERKLPLERLEYVPPVILTLKQLRGLCRFETGWSDLCGGDTPDYIQIEAEQPYTMTADDAIAAMHALRKKNPDHGTVYQDWYLPLYRLIYSVNCIHFEDTPADAETFRFLPSRKDYLNQLYEDDGAIEEMLLEELDIPDTAKYIENDLSDKLKNERRPVPERDYTDEEKEHYLECMWKGETLRTASEPELKLYRAFADELCEKDSVTALRCRGYGCYGGDPAYDCDWNTSLKCMLKLLELTGEAEYANTLGYIYYYGRCWSGEPQYEQAFRYFSIGAAGGWFESRYKLADMFVHGYAVPKNPKIACEIVSELYSENLKRFLTGDPCKFADVALRMGSYEESGYRGTASSALAYLYYLQAAFAIRQREKYHWYGDAKVAESIKKALDRLLSSGRIEKPKRTAEVSLHSMLYHYLKKYRKLQLKIRKQKSGDLELTVCIVPLPEEKHPPKLFITELGTGFCGLLDKLRVTVKNAAAAETAFGEDTVYFDDISGYDFLYGGEIAATIKGTYCFRNPEKLSRTKYRIASVQFAAGQRLYDYLLETEGVAAGDTVIVMTDKGETEVTVAAVTEKAESELPLPLARYRKIVRKK